MASRWNGEVSYNLFCLARVCLLAWAFIFAAQAHDIPNDVTVQVFLKPEGNLLRVAVRVPMRAMRDQQFPENKSGYLGALENIEPISKRLHATVWPGSATL